MTRNGVQREVLAAKFQDVLLEHAGMEKEVLSVLIADECIRQMEWARHCGRNEDLRAFRCEGVPAQYDGDVFLRLRDNMIKIYLCVPLIPYLQA